MKIKKWLYAAVMVIVLLGLDQWTKYLAVIHLKAQKPFVLIEHVFEFYYFENRGAAFGILQNRRILLVIFTLVVLVLILWFFSRVPDEKRYLPLQGISILIVAGALGNCIDRLIRGYVVDFLYFKLIDFPIFNVADCYVTVSFVLLVIFILFVYKEDELEELFPKRIRKKTSEKTQKGK